MTSNHLINYIYRYNFYRSSSHSILITHIICINSVVDNLQHYMHTDLDRDTFDLIGVDNREDNYLKDNYLKGSYLKDNFDTVHKHYILNKEIMI